jgi:hypothetical protein
MPISIEDRIEERLPGSKRIYASDIAILKRSLERPSKKWSY